MTHAQYTVEEAFSHFRSLTASLIGEYAVTVGEAEEMRAETEQAIQTIKSALPVDVEGKPSVWYPPITGIKELPYDPGMPILQLTFEVESEEKR